MAKTTGYFARRRQGLTVFASRHDNRQVALKGSSTGPGRRVRAAIVSTGVTQHPGRRGGSSTARETFDIPCPLRQREVRSSLALENRMSLIEAVFHNPLDAAFWSGLGSIIVIDLVLAGDNAIVIALAARNLPRHHQFRAIFWGTAGAIAVRVAMTAGVIWLLKIPGLMLIGGLVLIPIAWRLLKQDDGHDPHIKHAVTGFWSAMGTIVIADALMGLDNVLAIAGASGGHLGLVVLGLLVSVPLVVWGSTLLLKLIERYPAIIYIGAAAIAWTAARMITRDDLVKGWFDSHDPLRYVVDAVLVIGLVGTGWWLRHRKRAAH
jgi:YjbE family integral membrane protein